MTSGYIVAMATGIPTMFKTNLRVKGNIQTILFALFFSLSVLPYFRSPSFRNSKISTSHPPFTFNNMGI